MQPYLREYSSRGLKHARCARAKSRGLSELASQPRVTRSQTRFLPVRVLRKTNEHGGGGGDGGNSSGSATGETGRRKRTNNKAARTVANSKMEQQAHPSAIIFRAGGGRGECGTATRTAVEFRRQSVPFSLLLRVTFSLTPLFHSLRPRSLSRRSQARSVSHPSSSLCILSRLPFSILQPSFPFCCRAQFKSPPDR